MPNTICTLRDFRAADDRLELVVLDREAKTAAHVAIAAARHEVRRCASLLRQTCEREMGASTIEGYRGDLMTAQRALDEALTSAARAGVKLAPKATTQIALEIEATLRYLAAATKAIELDLEAAAYRAAAYDDAVQRAEASLEAARNSGDAAAIWSASRALRLTLEG